MLTELQKTRLVGAMRDIKDAPGWRFIRQLATAEAAEEKPDWNHLEEYLIEVFSDAIRAEFAAGIERQKGSKRQPVYPGRTQL